jgi:hypothetical protein
LPGALALSRAADTRRIAARHAVLVFHFAARYRYIEMRRFFLGYG